MLINNVRTSHYCYNQLIYSLIKYYIISIMGSLRYLYKPSNIKNSEIYARADVYKTYIR